MRYSKSIVAMFLFCSQVMGESPELDIDFEPREVVEAFLKENVNDASKLEIVKVAEPVSLQSVWIFRDIGYGNASQTNNVRQLGMGFEKPDYDGIALLVKYRATNAFGALVLTTRVFLIDEDGSVVESVAAEDFRVRKPEEKVDATVQAILKGMENANARPIHDPKLPKPDGDRREEKLRYWLNSKTKKRIYGRLLNHNEDSVAVQMKNGTEVIIPVNELSKADRIYVDRLSNESGS